jgi:predicted porin
MKKSLLAFAVLGAASGFAMAASNVTLYGIIDTGVAVSKVTKGSNSVKVSEASGTDSGSRWGLKGVEDLGNGVKTGFVLEQGFNSNNGAEMTSGLAFARQATIYVEGGFGHVGLGRAGTLASGVGYNMLTGWAFGTSYGDQGSWNSWAKNNGRTNNSIAYRTPSFGGFSITAMYSNGISTDTEKVSKNNHYYGIGAKYAQGPANASLIFEANDNRQVTEGLKPAALMNKLAGSIFSGYSLFTSTEVTSLDKDLKAVGYKSKTNYGITLGGNYNFNVATVYAGYQYAWNSDLYKQHILGLSAAVPVAGGTAKIGARYLIGEFDGIVKSLAEAADESKKFQALNIAAGYSYPLSKRTSVYSFAGWTKGYKQAKELDAGKYNGWTVSAGLKHAF